MIKHDNEYEIDLLQAWEIIKKNAVLFLAILLVCTSIAFAGTKLLMEKKYSATATAIIVKDNESGANQTVTYTDVQLSQKLVQTYSQIMMSEAISDTVIANLDLFNKYGIDSEEYRKIVSVYSVNNTEIMNITVETSNPQLSADIANEVVDVFQRKIFSIMNVDNVTILNRAKVPTMPSGPSARKNALIGLLVGLLICVVIALVKTLKDTKVKTEEEVKKILDYPIIGVIPEFTNENAGRRGSYGKR